MSRIIRTEKLKIDELVYENNEFVSKALLIDEIQGVKTNYIVVKDGGTFNATPEKNEIRVIFFIRGSGYVKIENKTFLLSDMAIFNPAQEASFTLCAIGGKIEFLEFLLDLTREDEMELSNKKTNEPYFKNYTECETYREAIKSDKTINRTLIPENTIPRFCMGSVETTGPDAVGTHVHPMLEQLFYGLPGNCCFVSADDSEILLEENTLLHIPLGSIHGARVEEGFKLHYLWLDFFRSNDMSYITKTHL